MTNNNLLSAPFIPALHEQRHLLDAIAEKAYNVIDYAEELKGAKDENDRRAIRENIRKCLYMIAHGVQRLSYTNNEKTRALVLEVLEGIDTAWEVSELNSVQEDEYKTIGDALNQALNLLDFFTVEELERYNETRKNLELYLDR